MTNPVNCQILACEQSQSPNHFELKAEGRKQGRVLLIFMYLLSAEYYQPSLHTPPWTMSESRHSIQGDQAQFSSFLVGFHLQLWPHSPSQSHNQGMTSSHLIRRRMAGYHSCYLLIAPLRVTISQL